MYYKLNDDKTVTKCSLNEWAKNSVEIEKHLRDDIINNKRISTIWLGIDHNFLDNESLPPLLFETMIFINKKESYTIYTERYSTYQEALDGHARLVELVKNLCKDDVVYIPETGATLKVKI